ncbi:MAG: hypothetical protein LUQ68_07345 [Methylococcaceae bacterium]|nr:hypothetical protein [Methylococcaceae bacterium]
MEIRKYLKKVGVTYWLELLY